jgi:hypothetical protein
VLQRVARAGDVVVLEGPQDEDHRIGLADVPEEPVPEALPLARPLHEAADVDELDRGGLHVLRVRHGRQLVETVVGDLGDPDVRVLGGERVGRGERGAARQRVVQG